MTALPDEGVSLPGWDETGLTVTLTRPAGGGRAPRLTVIGFIDVSTVAEFERALTGATADRGVILDLTRAAFVSSAAISVLFQRREDLDAVVVGADTIVALALRAAGFPTVSATGAGRGPR